MPDQSNTQYTGTLEELLTIGFKCIDQQQHAEAASIFTQLLAKFPKEPNALYGLGYLAYLNQRLLEAKSYLGEVLTVLPDHMASLEVLAAIALTEQQYLEAENFLKKALSLDSNNALRYFNLGVCYQTQGLIAAAEQYYQEALKRKIDYPECLLNLAIIYQAQKQWSKAEALCESALKINPNYTKAVMVLGGMYLDRAMYKPAEKRYLEAHRMSPADGNIIANLADLYHRQGQYDKARKYYQEALEKIPDEAQLRFNLSLLELLQGNYQQGFRDYAVRHRLVGKPIPASPALADWTLSPTNPVVILPEQGYGDFLQFLRFAKRIADQGGEVYAVHDAQMAPLLKNCPFLARVLTPLEYNQLKTGSQVWVADLPEYFSVELKDLSPLPPYIFSDPGRVKKWSEKLATNQVIKIGVCMAGNPAFINEINRSIPWEFIKELITQHKQIAWFDLTLSASKTEDENFKHLIHDLTPDIRDFADTAAIIEQLDLVITTDTVVAHLSGAMNKPCWVMLPYAPDWRWGLDTYESPWYPSIHLYRQKKSGEWRELIHSMSKALKAKFSGKSARHKS
jgi:tetratricopeptide (TPR) repeat protein/ADP-heptose:LPS heptosyltransferase